MNENILVSIVMPVYNEERYIKKCLDSLLKQTFDINQTEFIIVDGGSIDNTVELVKSYRKENFLILNNPQKLVTYALNLGIKSARGEFIIRMDAHAEYDKNYIERCIYYLRNIEAENVGGIAITKGEGFIGEGNAEILGSKFGVGNSTFRTETKSAYVDTVPFGAFHRSLFEEIGYFNPSLPRSEDNDFNCRIRATGGKIYLSSEIKFTYYCRNTIKGLLDQGLKNGNALFLTFHKNPKAMSLRHYIPFCFIISLILFTILSFIKTNSYWFLLIEGALYALLDFYFSFFKGKIKYSIYKFFMFPLFHICYGLGSFIGLLKIKLY